MDNAPRPAVFDRLADGRTVLFVSLAQAATPKPRMTVSEWADQHRVLPAEESARPGPWRTDDVPHLREPQDCLSVEHPARRVALRGSAQVAKTQIAINWLGYIADMAPGSMIMGFPSIDERSKFSNLRLQPSIDASERMKNLIIDQVSRDEKGSTTTLKKFSGGWAQLITVSSSKGMQGLPVRYISMDEVAEYPLDTDGRGNPVDQLRTRQKTFGDLAKEFATSTPGVKGLCKITSLFEEGDQRIRYLPCPHCGDLSPLRYENMRAGSPSTNGLPYFECRACGGIVEQRHRMDMFRAGVWIATSPLAGEQPPEIIPAGEISRWQCDPCEGRCSGLEPSYTIWAAYSPFEAWADIWNRAVAAQKDPEKFKTFCQQDLGEPYEPLSDAPDIERLLAVREDWAQGVVPYPAAVLTGFIDVQDGWFKWGVWGWGPGFQGYLVDQGIISLPLDDPAAWAAIDELTARTFVSAGGQEITPIAWGIDTGYQAQQLYDRVSRRHGLKACKGANQNDAPPARRSEASLRDRHGRPIPGRKIALTVIGNFDLKSTVYVGLRRFVAGPMESGGYKDRTLHLPKWVDEATIRELTAEVLVDRQASAKGNARRKLMRKAKDMREWVLRPGTRNECLDIVVGCMALAWEAGAGAIAPSRWEELVAEAHKPPAPPQDLFSAASVEAPVTLPESPAAPRPRPLAGGGNRLGRWQSR